MCIKIKIRSNFGSGKKQSIKGRIATVRRLLEDKSFTDRNLKGNFKIKDKELNMEIINQIFNKKSSPRYKLNQEVR